MESEIFEEVNGEVQQSKPKVEMKDTKDKTDEQAKGFVNTEKAKKEKAETKYEKALREAKEAMKETNVKIAELKKVTPKARSEEQKE